MPVQTLLMEFRIPTIVGTDFDRIFDLVRTSLEDSKQFGVESLRFLTKSTGDIFFVDSATINTNVVTQIYNGPRESIVTARVYNLKSVCTITVEYFLEEGEPELLTYDERKDLEATWNYWSVEAGNKEIPPQTTIPAILRATPFEVYFPTTDKRILQYDIDAMLYNATSPFQHIQIAHSKTYGNMLILDGDPNLAESDQIYNDAIMRRGVESYQGKEILILGGGDGGILRELLREGPKFVTMIEIDEMVIDACRQHLRSICGNVMDNLTGKNYEIIIADCFPHLQKMRERGVKFDYIFDDLTTIPVNGDTHDDQALLEFQKRILEAACSILKPESGKLMAHGPGAPGLNSTNLLEDTLNECIPKSCMFNLDKQTVFVPSFMESWAFYQVDIFNY